MRLVSALLHAAQIPFGSTPSPAADAVASSPEAANKARFVRDFSRHPLRVNLSAHGTPAQVVVLPDVHAAANRLFPLLLANGVIRRSPQGAVPSESCGGDDPAAWGAFRWDNPYVWDFGDNAVLSLGDRIDKGPFNLVTECFFRDLTAQAKRAGGQVHTLWGNHEVQTGAAWNNTKTRGPGGLLYELWGYGIEPQQFFANDGVFGGPLRRRPLLAQLGDDILFVHGGLCPGKQTLDRLLDDVQKGLKRDGFATETLQNENSMTRCRLQAGHRGHLTPGNATEIIYAHDPEHEPRGEPYCFSVQRKSQKPHVYCRTDVGLTPYINYSLGALLRYRSGEAGFARESCNELGACLPLQVDAPATWGPQPARAAAAPSEQIRRLAPPAAMPHGLLPFDPGRSPHRGLRRNYTTYPTMAVLSQLRGDLFVVGEPRGALLPLKRLLVASGLIAEGPLLGPPRWTGGDAVLVACGNLFGEGYFNLETMRLFAELDPQARATGGRVMAVLGAREVDFLHDPNNDDTWAGGGLATQLVGQGSWPEDFAQRGNPLYTWLQNGAFGVRVHDLLVLSGGQTSNRYWEDIGANLAEALERDGFGASFVSGENSVTKKVGFAGKEGRQGPTLARDAGVTTIVHALDLLQAPVDDIKLYGRKNGVDSLINVATRLNPALGEGEGKLLRVRRRGEELRFDAIDVHGRRERLARRPRDAGRSV